MGKNFLWSADLGGLCKVEDPEVLSICNRAVIQFEKVGTSIVSDKALDLSDCAHCWQVLRGLSFSRNPQIGANPHWHEMKPEIVWNTELGIAAQAVPGLEEVALAKQQELKQRVNDIFAGGVDLLATPATCMASFPAALRYPFVKNCTNYLDWMAFSWAFSITDCPSLVLPCGWTSKGLPVGLQLVAAPWKEGKLLSAAAVL